MMTVEEFKEKFYDSELIEEAEPGDMLIWIPEAKLSSFECKRNILIRFSEGCGDNLDEDDIDNGYDSYVNFDVESCYDSDHVFRDGGMQMYNSDETYFEEVCEDIIKECFGYVEEFTRIKI